MNHNNAEPDPVDSLISKLDRALPETDETHLRDSAIAKFEASEPSEVAKAKESDNSERMMKVKKISHLATKFGFIALAVLAVLQGFEWVMIIGALAFMLFMHELGHYLTARWSGMKVTEFFIGFGPRIWSFRKGETEYGIKAIWLGAYVRIVGMNNLDEVEPDDEERSFRAQSYPKKMLVLVAGSVMHFLMALTLLYLVLVVEGIGVGADASFERDDWTLGTISLESAASAAGLQPGDKLISMNGAPPGTFDEFARTVAGSLKGESVTVVYARDGIEHTATVTIGEGLTEAGAAGISGLIAGDHILSVEGLTTDGAPTYAEIAQYVSPLLGQPLDIRIVDARTGEYALVQGAVFTQIVDEVNATRGYFGVSARYEKEKLGLFAGAEESVRLFGRITKDIVLAFPAALGEGVGGALGWVTSIVSEPSVSVEPIEEVEAQRLTISNTDANRLLSVYGIARLGAEVASDSLTDLMVLIGVVNIFVGVFNLLPLLPLDGGHMAVGTYERIRSIGGRSYQVDAARLIPITYAVVSVLLLIGGVALIRDILDPVTLI